VINVSTPSAKGREPKAGSGSSWEDSNALRQVLSELEPAAAGKVEVFCRLLLERNASVNLTGARSAETLAEHIRDSLALCPYLREPFVDVGSGGGLPAIPVAIVTGLRGTLVESVAKKSRFLAEAVQLLDLPLTVRSMRAEIAGREGGLRGSFAAATARAVGSLSTVLELTVPLLAVGGIAILQRGRIEDWERTAATDAALVLGAAVEDEFHSGVEGMDERRIVLVRKVKETGPRFPRRPGIPEKRPLCVEAGRA
jgi:16S rRNA (guanine527-N7)-methyltransferase